MPSPGACCKENGSFGDDSQGQASQGKASPETPRRDLIKLRPTTPPRSGELPAQIMMVEQILETVVEQSKAVHFLTSEHVTLREILQQQHCELMESIKMTFCKIEHELDVGPLSSSKRSERSEGRHQHPDMSTNHGSGMTNTQTNATIAEGEVDLTALAKQVSRKWTGLSRNTQQRQVSIRARSFLSLPEAEIPGLKQRLQDIAGSNKFELFMAAVVVLNMLTMIVHLEWEGQKFAYDLGLRDNDAGWQTIEISFLVAEKMFNGIYVLELILRVWAFRCSFFREPFNVWDSLIVLATCSVSFILEPLMMRGAQNINLSALRLTRVFRIFRIAKIFRFTEHLGELRVLVKTLLLSARTVASSVLLITGIVLASAVLMTQLSFSFLLDESVKFETRKWLHEVFGTTSAAAYTMFECTFTGGWRFYSRPIIEDVSVGFAIFWIPYVICVNFTVVRVISALFLHQTMSVAAIDSDRQAMEHMKQKEMFAAELRAIFEHGEEESGGCISRSGFAELLSIPDVILRFVKLGLELEEVVALFGVLSADDGTVNSEEFLEAALKMRSGARAMDTLQIMHVQLQHSRVLQKLMQRLSELTRAS